MKEDNTERDLYVRAHNQLVELKRDMRAVNRYLKNIDENNEEIKELKITVQEKINSKESVIRLIKKKIDKE